MKNDFLPSWFQKALFSSLAVIMILMPFHAFISTWGGTASGPLWLWKSWKEILLVFLAIPVVVWLSWQPKRWQALINDKLFWLIICFVGLLGMLNVSYWSINGRDAVLAGMAMDTRYLLIFGLGYVLFRFGRFNWVDLRRKIALFLIAAGVLLALIGLFQVFILPADFLSSFGYDKHTTIAPYVLIDENPGALRAFATLRGPNDFGAFLILPLLLSILFARRNKWFLVASATMLAGLFVSGSRSAWVGIFISIIALLIVTFGSRIFRSRQAIVITAASAAVLIIVGCAAITVPALRLTVFHSSPGDSSLTEGSTDQHWSATAAGIQRVINHPFGCGAGCAGPASYYSSSPKISENYYVQIAEETGLIGLGLWLAIVITVAQRLWTQRYDWMSRALLASLAGLSAIGFWLHVWSDDPLSLTWWLIAGIIIGHYASVTHTKALS